MIAQLQKAQYVVVIVQRLADSHENHVTDAKILVVLSHISRDLYHLQEDVACRQGSAEACLGRSAEAAAHFASHLRGKANAVTVLVGKQNAFHVFAIVHTVKEFYSSIYLRYIFFKNKIAINLKE